MKYYITILIFFGITLTYSQHKRNDVPKLIEIDFFQSFYGCAGGKEMLKKYKIDGQNFIITKDSNNEFLMKMDTIFNYHKLEKIEFLAKKIKNYISTEDLKLKETDRQIFLEYIKLLKQKTKRKRKRLQTEDDLIIKEISFEYFKNGIFNIDTLSNQTITNILAPKLFKDNASWSNFSKVELKYSNGEKLIISNDNPIYTYPFPWKIEFNGKEHINYSVRLNEYLNLITKNEFICKNCNKVDIKNEVLFKILTHIYKKKL